MEPTHSSPPSSITRGAPVTNGNINILLCSIGCHWNHSGNSSRSSASLFWSSRVILSWWPLLMTGCRRKRTVGAVLPSSSSWQHGSQHGTLGFQLQKHALVFTILLYFNQEVYALQCLLNARKYGHFFGGTARQSSMSPKFQNVALKFLHAALVWWGTNLFWCGMLNFSVAC